MVLMLAPTKVTVRMYQVGFGDCFLLKFHYRARQHGDKHVLIDFGTTALPKWVKGTADDWMTKIAEDIRETCGGRLDAVVATHRHRDHISGFANGDDAKAPGGIIRALEPRLVIQPWTEDPNAEPDAHAATVDLPREQAFVRSLVRMQDFAELVARRAAQLQEDQLQQARLAKKALRRNAQLARLEFLGSANVANRSAVENLIAMGKVAERGAAYVRHGSSSGLDELLPGVRVHVLGPPDLTQSKEVRKHRRVDRAEYWHFQADFWQSLAAEVESAAGGAAGAPSFTAPEVAAGKHPAYTRWLSSRLDRLHSGRFLELVRTLDKALNNTSVILLFEVGRSALLFPGDAQIENWSYALKAAPQKDRDRLDKLLKRVRLYKVGHHGSLNATPKTMWKKLGNKGRGPRQLGTLISTLRGKHGDTGRGTEVPRDKLVKALRGHSLCRSTDDPKVLPKMQLYHDEVINL
jgi:hypothetical protein